MLPWTRVKVLLFTVLNCRTPASVVVLAVALEISSVTVVLGEIVTALQALGTIPESQVLATDHRPLFTDLKAEHPIGAQLTVLLVSLRSKASPAKAPL